MGTIYSVACKDCKVVRDLDKFSGARKIKTRADALKYCKAITEQEGLAFRAALLVSFMAEHAGHDCVFFEEYSSCADELSQNNDYKEDTDYWVFGSLCSEN